jgi:hypothetical protein
VDRIPDAKSFNVRKIWTRGTPGFAIGVSVVLDRGIANKPGRMFWIFDPDLVKTYKRKTTTKTPSKITKHLQGD